MELQNLNNTKQPDKTLQTNQWLGNWIWRSVQCLVECPDFNASPKWSAQKLNVSVDKIVEAFEGLETLGFIKKENNTYIPVTNWMQITPIHTTKSELLDSHTKLAPQILSNLTTNDKFTVQFFRGNDELLAKYAPKFVELYKQMNLEAEKLGLTEVIASEICFAKLTNKAVSTGGIQ